MGELQGDFVVDRSCLSGREGLHWKEDMSRSLETGRVRLPSRVGLAVSSFRTWWSSLRCLIQQLENDRMKR